jgi:hypothetical protein
MDELKEYAKSLFAQLPPEAILEILSEVERWKLEQLCVVGLSKMPPERASETVNKIF